MTFLLLCHTKYDGGRYYFLTADTPGQIIPRVLEILAELDEELVVKDANIYTLTDSEPTMHHNDLMKLYNGKK